MSNQLVKKNPAEGYQNVFPKTWIDAIKDKESGVSLQEILQGFNMYFLSYNGSRALTRCKVPSILRKEGLWITYVLYDHTVVTEWYNSDQIDDNSWSMDSNWRIASNNLVGDISVSSDGYWVINGKKTEARAQGKQGVTPLLRVGANNKLQVSYNAGKVWKDISDYIVPRFKWNQGVGTTAGTIQISMDLGKTWTNLSNEITNNLRISRYIGINESLPTSGVAEGTIYMKGPYYDESDTSNANPIYRMWIYAWKGNTLAWQDNGEFTSIGASVVQERGNSTTEVMSQDAITRELTKLEEEAGQLRQYIERIMCFSDIPSYIGNLTGTGASGDSGRYKVIPIKPNDEITIYPVTETGCYYFVTKSFDSQNTETFETATGFSGRQSSTQNVTIEIPSDGYFLIVATSIYSNTCVPNNITINGISVMNGLVSQIETNKIVGEESSAYLFKVTINEADAYLSEAGLMPGDFHCKYTSKIFCKKNDVFHYRGSSLYTSPCAAVVYDRYGAVVDSWKPNSSSINKNYTISANSAAFVIFSSYLEGTSSEPTLEVNKVGNYITLEDAVDDLNKRFDDKFALHESVNLFNNQDPLIKNGLYGISDFVANDDYRVTGPIAVKGGVSYKFPHYNNVFGTSKRYAIVDAENNVIQVVLDQTATDYFTITPSFDCFISCQLTPSTLNSFMVCKASEYPSSYVPYNEYVYLKGTKVYSSDIIGQIDNPLYGKKISFNGDSICQGISASGGYGVIIATENEMEYQNIGISGGTICGGTYYPGGETPRHWISRTIQNMDSDSDFAIVEGGVNDMWNGLSLGALSNGYDATLDDTTFYGAMESVCKQLTTRFQGKKYGFIIVHCVDTGWYYKTSNYYKAIIECCNKWGVPFIDLNLIVPPLGLFPQSATELYAIRSQYTNNADGCHLTQDGYKKFYTNKITEWLKSL